MLAILIALMIVVIAFEISGLVFWGIGSFVIWAFGLGFAWTFWHGLAVAFIVNILARIFGGHKNDK